MTKSNYLWTSGIVIILFLLLFLAYYFINTPTKNPDENKELSSPANADTILSPATPTSSSTTPSNSLVLDDFINSLKQDSAQIDSLANDFDL